MYLLYFWCKTLYVSSLNNLLFSGGAVYVFYLILYRQVWSDISVPHNGQVAATFLTNLDFWHCTIYVCVAILALISPAFTSISLFLTLCHILWGFAMFSCSCKYFNVFLFFFFIFLSSFFPELILVFLYYNFPRLRIWYSTANLFFAMFMKVDSIFLSITISTGTAPRST